MRRILALGFTVASVLVLAQGTGSSSLEAFNKALNSAKTLNATFTVQPIGGVANSYTIEFAKPNKARIDSNNQLVVADGKTITVYDKKDKSYYKQPQTDAELKALLKPDELATWSAFFGGNPYGGASVKSLGTKSRKGENLDAVQIMADAKGRKTVTLYVSTTDKLTKQAEYKISDQGVNETTILSTRSITLDRAETNGAFAFNPPSDSREISLEELNASKWYTDLNEALGVAKKTGKRVFIDFMASWCGPCKMLEREVFHSDKFKELQKSFVMVQIDVDEQHDVAQSYKIEAMPTQIVTDSDGNELGRTVGYGGPDRFYSWIGGYAK